jgi:predicted hydrocarbon binding protein
MDDLVSLIARAQEDMRAYAARLHRDPALAEVALGTVAHALVPSQVMTRDLRKILHEVVGADVGATVLHRLGREIGRVQAAAFFKSSRSDGRDPRSRVLAGPFHLAWAGYGDVDLLVWEPHLDDRFAVLWESDNSSSARAAAGEDLRTRACHLEAGYSAGWCSEATGLRLQARELACRAEDVSHCRFLIGHAERMADMVVDPRFHRPTARYAVTPARLTRR